MTDGGDSTACPPGAILRLVGAASGDSESRGYERS
jgi:hypothetical protein